MTQLAQTRTYDVRIGEEDLLVLPAELRDRLGIEDGDTVAVSLFEDGSFTLRRVSSDPIERLRKAMAGTFAGVDPVEYQRSIRDEDEG